MLSGLRVSESHSTTASPQVAKRGSLRWWVTPVRTPLAGMRSSGGRSEELESASWSVSRKSPEVSQIRICLSSPTVRRRSPLGSKQRPREKLLRGKKGR